jgi:hypothetical protein
MLSLFFGLFHETKHYFSVWFGLIRFVSLFRTFTETTETDKPVSKQTESHLQVQRMHMSRCSTISLIDLHAQVPHMHCRQTPLGGAQKHTYTVGAAQSLNLQIFKEPRNRFLGYLKVYKSRRSKASLETPKGAAQSLIYRQYQVLQARHLPGQYMLL